MQEDEAVGGEKIPTVVSQRWKTTNNMTEVRWSEEITQVPCVNWVAKPLDRKHWKNLVGVRSNLKLGDAERNIS